MVDLLSVHYDWIRAGHIIAMVSWMAGMLYLPRLFVYHVNAPKGSDMSETFKIMERRLLKIIINPAMILTWIFGCIMLYVQWEYFKTLPWMHAKLLFVVLMTGVHHVYIKYVKLFAADENTKSTKYFRILNEVPTVLMIFIVILAVAEPF
ncbi:MAG: protoporphyrinogen oxidase HemJ [Alphaproteobacteria bacterium]